MNINISLYIYYAPLSIEFSRHEYWSGLSFPSPGDFPNPGIEPGSLALQADPAEIPGKSIFRHALNHSIRSSPLNLSLTSTV